MKRSTFFKTTLAAVAAFFGFKNLPVKPKSVPEFGVLDLSGLRDVKIREATSLDNGKTWCAYSKDFPNIGDEQPVTWEGSNPKREDLHPMHLNDSRIKLFIS